MRVALGAAATLLIFASVATDAVAEAVHEGSGAPQAESPPPPVEADSSDEDSARALRAQSWSVPVLHATGLFVTLRLTEAILYPDPFAETRLSVIGAHYREAFTRPPKFDASRPAFEWDGDPWHINAVGHALLGSELYLRARTCGNGVLESLAFTAAGAVVWDYAFEANGVRPSALDLVYTPAAGLALGEFRHWLWSSSRGFEHSGWRTVLQVVFDPLGEAERWAGVPC